MAYDRISDTYGTDEEILEIQKERSRVNKLEHKKNAVVARKPIGTVAGNKQRVQEFKEKLLAAPVGESIIRKVLDIARDDEHPGQMMAIKMCMDRLLPTSLFEDKKDTTRTAIQITISGIGESRIINDDDADVIDVS